MLVYDETRDEWIDVPAPVDHSQNPLIGIALLLLVLWLAWVASGSPAIVITGW